MFKESSPTSPVEVLIMVEDELKNAAIVAEASTKALGRAVLLGTIPIIEFGAIIVFSLLIARLPMKIIERVSNG